MSGRIRFGIHGSSRLAEGIIASAGHRPQEVEFVRYEATDPFRQLRQGLADVMIIKYDLLEPDLVYSGPVAHDGRAALVGSGHPLASKDSVSVEEVADYEVFQCPGDFPPNVWDQVVPPRTPGGRELRRVHPLTTFEALTDLLTRTRAVHLSVASLAALALPGVKVLPVLDLPAAPVHLAWLREGELRADAARFVADAERNPVR